MGTWLSPVSLGTNELDLALERTHPGHKHTCVHHHQLFLVCPLGRTLHVFRHECIDLGLFSFALPKRSEWVVDPQNKAGPR